MTPRQVIVEVRRLVQDTRSGAYRYSDDELLGYVNQGVSRIALLRPDLFTVTQTIPTTSGVVFQQLPQDASRLVELFYTVGGAALEESDREMFDRAYPNWINDPAGLPTKYIRHPRNPVGFFLYPKPQAGVQLLAEYVKVPVQAAIDETIPLLSEAYFSALVDVTVFLAESVDNEHVNSGRAKLFFDSFTQGIAVSLQSRNFIDNDSAGVQREMQAPQ